MKNKFWYGVSFILLFYFVVEVGWAKYRMSTVASLKKVKKIIPFKLTNRTPFPVPSVWLPLSPPKKIVNTSILNKKRREKNFYTIMIDPGHGGKDTGARGPRGLEEKQVVLVIAKRLYQKLNDMPHIQAYLTRRNDSYVPLRKRLALARNNHADLFIAIHADAYFNGKAKGASVYAVSKRGATSEAARWLANQENYSELEDIRFRQLKDSSVMVRSMLIDLAQTVTIREGLRLGHQILKALSKVTQLHHGKVEQAPFVVLKSPDIPSILIETGFISHPEEEKRLASPYYQEKMAESLAKGIQQYIKNSLSTEI